jgi:hypothetical protein
MAEFLLRSLIKIFVAIIMVAFVCFIPLKTVKKELSIVPKVEAIHHDKSLSVTFGKTKMIFGTDYYNVWRTTPDPSAKIIQIKSLRLIGEKVKYDLDIF